MTTDLNLSIRLQTIMQEMTYCSVLADVGTDHAYIPCYACLQGYAATAIATDIATGPLSSAREQIQACGLEAQIQLRQGSGLSVLQPNEADVVVMAGMGGALMVDILAEDEAKLAGVRQLILQPNIGEKQVRQWLADHHWALTHEAIIKEDGHIYEVLTAVPGDGQAVYAGQSEFALTAGPYLMKEKNRVFREKWRCEQSKWQHIYEQLTAAQPTVQNKTKKRNVARYIQHIKEMLS